MSFLVGMNELRKAGHRGINDFVPENNGKGSVTDDALGTEDRMAKPKARPGPPGLPPACPTALAKNVQPISPDSTSNGYGYGRSPLSKPPNLPMKTVKTTMSIAGWRTAQATPSTACL